MRDESTYWQRRSSRRTFLAGSAATVGGLLTAAVAGCGDDDDDGAGDGTPSGQAIKYDAPPAYSKLEAQKLLGEYHWSKVGPKTQVRGTPKPGGVLVMPTASFGLVSLHPTEEVVGQWPFCYTHNNLLAMDFNHTKQPDALPATTHNSLSSKWEQPDASTIVFTLRPGVKWHNKAPANGAPLTIDDIKATYDLFKASTFHKTKFKDLAKVEETAPGTVRFTTSAPAAHLINTLRIPQFSVLNAKHISEGKDALTNKAIGTGAFTQENFKADTIRVYKKNPNFHEKDANGVQLPYLDGVVHQVIADNAAAIAAYRTGRVDAYRPVSVEEFNRIRGELDTWAQVTPGFCGCNVRAIIPNYRQPEFKDVRVRRALSLAVNRQDMIDTVFGGAANMRGYLTWYYAGLAWPKAADDMGEWNKYDVAKAKQLLAAANIKTPIKFDIHFAGQILPGTGQTTGNPYVESLRRDFKAIGVELEPKPLAPRSTLYFEQTWNGLFAGGAGSATSLDADDFLQYLATGSGLNGLGLSDPTIDSGITKYRSAFDSKERVKVAGDLDKYIAEDQLSFGIMMPDQFQLSTWRKYVHNIVDSAAWWITGGSGHQMVDVWMDDEGRKRNIDSF